VSDNIEMNTAGPRLGFMEKAARLQGYLNETIAGLNAAANDHRLGVRFVAPDQDDVLHLVGRVDDSFFVGDGERLFAEQLDTAVEVMKRLLNGDCCHEHVAGLCQSGKNGVITCLNDFLGPVFLAAKGCWVQPMVWLPNNRGMEQQSERKFRQACLLNSCLRVQTTGGEPRTVQHYREQLRIRMSAAVGRVIERDRLEPSTAQRLRREFNDFGRDGAFSFRRSKTKEPLFKLLARAGLLADILPALVMDESHIAIGARQGADSQLAAPLDEADDERERREDAEDARQTVATFYGTLGGGRGLLVSVSATNTPFNLTCYERDRRPVYLQVGPGYCGFPFVEGDAFPARHPVIEPEVIPVGELARRMGDAAVARIDLRAFNGVTNFVESLAARDWERVRLWLARQGHPGLGTARAKGRNAIARLLSETFAGRLSQALAGCELVALFGQAEAETFFTGGTDKDRKDTLQRLAARHADRVGAALASYRGECQNAFGRIWEWLLLTVNPRKKQGGLVRWEVRNDGFDRFIRPLNERYRGRLKFIGYMADHATRSAADVIREQNPEGLPYVLVVTGMGRYGESYPPGCGYAFDGTNKNSTVASFTQSLLGRMSGYGKHDPDDPDGTRPLVILSDNAHREVFLPWRQTKGAPLTVPMHQQVRYEGQRRGRAIGYCVLERRHADAALQRLFEEMQPFVAYAAGRPSKRALNARDIGRDLYDVLEPYFAHIEANLSRLNPERYGPGARARILRRDERDVDGCAYDWFGRTKHNGSRRLKYQLRLHKDTVQGGGLMTTRNTAGGEGSSGRRDTGRYWQVALEYAPGGRVERILLPFVGAVSYDFRLVRGLRNRTGNVPDRVGSPAPVANGGD
jgi:hypothetical protein